MSLIVVTGLFADRTMNMTEGLNNDKAKSEIRTSSNSLLSAMGWNEELLDINHLKIYDSLALLSAMGWKNHIANPE